MAAILISRHGRNNNLSVSILVNSPENKEEV